MNLRCFSECGGGCPDRFRQNPIKVTVNDGCHIQKEILVDVTGCSKYSLLYDIYISQFLPFIRHHTGSSSRVIANLYSFSDIHLGAYVNCMTVYKLDFEIL